MPLKRGCRTLSTAPCLPTYFLHTYPSSHTSPVSIYSSFHFLSPFPLRLHLPHSNDRSYKCATDFGGFPFCQNHHFHCAWQEYWITQKTWISNLAKVQDYAKSQHFPHTLHHRQRNCENPGTAGSLLICATIYSISIISVCLVLRLYVWWNLCLFT